MVIRKAKPENAYDYTLCHINCWRDAYEGIIPEEFLENRRAEQEERSEQCRKTLSEPGDCEYFYAEFDGKMVGRLVFGKSNEDNNPDAPEAGEIHAIYLLKDYWDKGYGRQMLDFAFAELKQSGYKEVFIWVIDENTRGRQFYEKHGFSLDGKTMELNLGKPLTLVRYTYRFK